eukprot:6483708-Prymnesium_polylepis.1
MCASAGVCRARGRHICAPSMQRGGRVQGPGELEEMSERASSRGTLAADARWTVGKAGGRRARS